MSLLDNSDYIDVTQALMSSLGDRLVQSPLFDLLEGTRAVEATNPRLDTGLIPLEPEEVKFDTRRKLDNATTAAIQDRLIVSTMGWLNKSSLPVTVLSCRYVQELVEQYMGSKGDLWTRCGLGPNRVLSGFIMGLCKFIDGSLVIGKNSSYEEEDMTSRKMNLDLLSELSIDQVLAEVVKLQEEMAGQGEKVLAAQLQLVVDLNHIFGVLQSQMEIFDPLVSNTLDLSTLDEGAALVDRLAKEVHVEVPAHSFSKYIQVHCDNNIIPLELFEFPREEAYASMRGIFTDIKEIVETASRIQNVDQLDNFLTFDILSRVEHYNSLTRGIFQLFLVRDNSSVLGSSSTLRSLVSDKVDNLVGRGTAVVRNNSSNEVAEFMAQLEQALYHNLTIAASNTCRQQQLTSRSLVVWDSLQVGWESVEASSASQGDVLVSGGPSYPVSAFIYNIKLEHMVRMVLHGVELELYRDYEMYWAYWYTSYLVQTQINHLEGHVQAVIDGKIHALTTVAQQNIRKLKDGPAKDKAKVQYSHNLRVVVPQLRRTAQYNKSYRVASLQALHALTSSVRLLLLVYAGIGAANYTNGPPNSLTSFSNLYRLRMKPWSSIGVPEAPSFEQYTRSLDVSSLKGNYASVLAVVDESLAKARTGFQEIVRGIEGPLKPHFARTDYALDWYRGLVKTCIVYALEVKSLRKNDLGRGGRVVQEKGYHPMFPIIKLAKEREGQ